MCERKFCPLQIKVASQKKATNSFKQDFFGSSPNIFIGRFGYPNINVGILSTEEYKNHDDPLLWSRTNTQIPEIIDKRTQLVNSNFRTSIRSFKDRLLEMSQEISLSTKPVDVEINLDRKPGFKLSLNQDTMPHGPVVAIKKAAITENPKIPKKVDYLVSDPYVKAAEAVNALFDKGYDEHYLTKVLSVGNLGIEKDKRLVPTRWSITAVDDTVGKNLIQRVKQFKEADYCAYFGGYLGNYYLILTFPEPWSYELFETVVGERVSFATDYEPYRGRKSYASETAGGYYAARLAILERLANIKRQASVLALRFVTNEYWAPLGVWVVREATRKSISSKPLEFASRELMMHYARLFIKKKFNLDLDILLNESKLMKNIKDQKKLTAF